MKEEIETEGRKKRKRGKERGRGKITKKGEGI